MTATAATIQAKRWYWQHISAMALAICVFIHIGVIIYAVRGGLTAAEILARTHGSWVFGIFYSVFVIACAMHVPVGIANIAQEWFGLSAPVAAIISKLFGLIILVMGLQAVFAVTLS
jgi:fumarate reductase subunit C